MEQTEPSWLLS